MKPIVEVKRLANWYFGNFCIRCANLDMEDKNHGKDCWDKLQLIADKLKAEKMTHREFMNLIRYNSNFCKPIKRKFPEWSICKALNIPQRR